MRNQTQEHSEKIEISYALIDLGYLITTAMIIHTNILTLQVNMMQTHTSQLINYGRQEKYTP